MTAQNLHKRKVVHFFHLSNQSCFSFCLWWFLGCQVCILKSVSFKKRFGFPFAFVRKKIYWWRLHVMKVARQNTIRNFRYFSCYFVFKKNPIVRKKATMAALYMRDTLDRQEESGPVNENPFTGALTPSQCHCIRKAPPTPWHCLNPVSKSIWIITAEYTSVGNVIDIC